MLRKWGTLVFLLLATPLLAMSQNTGKLAGQVLDTETGDPLPGASIALAGTQVGTISDIDGNYFIIGVPVGTFDVQASFVGYGTQTVSRVEINAGYTREINFSLSPGVELDEIVVEYERPLIQKDAIGAPKVVTGEEIVNLPVRGAGRVASLQSGVISNDSDGSLYVRGGRNEQVIFFVDGVKVIGNLGVPQQAVQEQEMLIGAIPAKFGDAMSGIISITTKSGAPKFFGSLEAITSEVLDPWGYNLFSGTIGGPIIKNKLSFFLSGEALLQSDSNPYAVDRPQLSDEQLGSLLASPQVLQIEDDETGDYRYLPMPANLPDTISFADFDDLLVVPDGFSVHSNTPIDGGQVITADDWKMVDSKNDGRDRFDVNGNFTYTPSKAISVRAGGSYSTDKYDNWAFSQSIYARLRSEGGVITDNLAQGEDQTLRLFTTWTHRVADATFYQLQFDYTTDQFNSYPAGFSKNLEDAALVGDISDPRNEALAAYRILADTDGDGAADSYVRRFRDGQLFNPSNVVNVWRPVGEPTTDFFSQTKDTQLRFSGSATTQVGVHQLEFGGEFEQRTQRAFSVNGNSLSRYICDDVTASNCGAENLQASEVFDTNGNLIGPTAYSNIPFNAFRASAYWYGYDFRGLNEVDDQNIDTYLDDSAESNHNVAPWKPIYYAGYIQDKIEFRDLVINLGLRVDVFDSNTLVLRDQGAPAPVIRVSDTDLVNDVVVGDYTIPSNIQDDYAVYFTDAGEIVGFRSIDGDFFDAAGQDTDLSTIDNGGKQRQKPGTQQLASEIFKDYEPEITWMPRVGVSFPVTNQALFFASYNITSQRPRERAFAAFSVYDQISGQNRLNNPDLKPEKTVQYELGFRQSLGTRAAFQVSAFLRQQKDLIQVRNVRAIGLGVGAYGVYQNIDFATTKGLEFEFDLRRTNGVALRANYTFSVAQATGSDSATLGVIAWRGTLAEGLYFPNFISPAQFDRRHSANLSFDYRLGRGEGPKIGDTAFLENFGINASAQLGSGMPYTALLNAGEIWNSFTSNVDGSINGRRMPWYSILDLRVDRRFNMSDRTALTAFLWIENVLDQNNTLGVYRATGRSDQDGFLDSGLGSQLADNAGQVLGDDLARESFVDNYAAYVNSPIGSGGNHYSGGVRYSVPRRIRLGVRVNFSNSVVQALSR